MNVHRHGEGELDDGVVGRLGLTNNALRARVAEEEEDVSLRRVSL